MEAKGLDARKGIGKALGLHPKGYVYVIKT
jgi:hypothetical protein